jgi:hypothetical protein
MKLTHGVSRRRTAMCRAFSPDPVSRALETVDPGRLSSALALPPSPSRTALMKATLSDTACAASGAAAAPLSAAAATKPKTLTFTRTVLT